MKISLKVIPGARQNEVVQYLLDLFGVRVLKIKVNQPPENGRANMAVVKCLANYFRVKKSSIKIILGLTSTNKIVEIDLP